MSQNHENRPNILFTLVDDFGRGDVGDFNPHAALRTDHLDRLATEGMRFTDAYATSAPYTPSRYSLLTVR